MTLRSNRICNESLEFSTFSVVFFNGIRPNDVEQIHRIFDWNKVSLNF